MLKRKESIIGPLKSMFCLYGWSHWSKLAVHHSEFNWECLPEFEVLYNYNKLNQFRPKMIGPKLDILVFAGAC